MRRFLTMQALLVPVLAVCAAAAAPRSQADPDLRRDARLQQKLTLRGEVVGLHQVVRLLGEATGVDILVQGDLLRRPVALRVRERSAAEIMEQLAVLFGGTWVRKEEAYLLVTDQVTAKLIAAYPSEGSTEREEEALSRSLSPQQLERVLRADIRFEELTPAQQRLVLAIARDRYLRRPHRYLSTLLLGKGIRLRPRLVVEGQDAPPVRPVSPDLRDPSLKGRRGIFIGAPAIGPSGEELADNLGNLPISF